MTTQLHETQGSRDAAEEGHRPSDHEPTLGMVLASNTAELDDDLTPLHGTSFDQLDRGDVQRSTLLVVADRLLRRLAGDETRVSELNAACKAEVAMLTARYASAAMPLQKAAVWKRWCLEKMAAILLPDAKTKPKSINLPYGTLSRTDKAETHELVDKAAAIELARIQARKHVKLTIESDLEKFEQDLIALVRKIEGKGTINGSIREFIDDCVDNKMGTTTAALDFKWGAAKKDPAIALYAVLSAGFPEGHGVRKVEASTVFTAKITEG